MTTVIHDPREMQTLVLAQRAAGKRIGFVPTMGALHEGHLSLVRAAKLECDTAVASIFVNPTQFGPSEDFARYPRTLETDLEMLRGVACDYAFVPPAEAMYPPGFSTYVEPPSAAHPLEGAIRPGHFRGVCTIVLKLLEIVPADRSFFGQKDFQQALVIRRMMEDLCTPGMIRICPIVREADGLAMSSRNRYLSAGERRIASAIPRALEIACDLVEGGERETARIHASMRRTLSDAGIERIDYAEVRHAHTLGEISQLERPAVALIACRVGNTRLIDNHVWE